MIKSVDFITLILLRVLKKKKAGSDLLSHITAVPSALKDFTSLFGMVKGVSPSLLPPTILQFLYIISLCLINIVGRKNSVSRLSLC